MEADEIEIISSAAAVVGQALLLLADSSDEDDNEIEEKNEGFWEVTISNFSSKQFRRHFRLKPENFELLYVLLGEFYGRRRPNIPHPGQPAIKLEKKILMCLWYLANMESFRSVSDRFGVCKFSCWDSCKLVFELIVELNSHSRIIAFPNEYMALNVIREFEEKNGFPGILGVIDGCHIRIEKPKTEPNSYINRKGYPSVLLQGICDNKKRFIDVYAGEAGSIHDYRLFTKSPVYQSITHNQIQFPNNSHLIGDLAYKLSKKLIVGYKDNGNLTQAQKLFNTMLNKNRIVIENAFGILKSRWRRLKMIETKRMDLIALTIFSSCVLHNFAINNNDIFVVAADDEEEFDDVKFNEENEDQEARLKRENIKNLLYIRHNVNR